MNWDLFVQLTMNGLTLGSVYALVALGFSMVYGILKLLNFAHGDVVMVGAFIGWGILSWLGGPTSPNIAGLGADHGDDRRRHGRLRIPRHGDRAVRVPAAAQRPRIAPLISALGVSFFIQNSVLLLYGADFRTYDTFEWSTRGLALEWGVLRVWIIRLVVMGSAVAMMGGFMLIVARTRLGKAMRATSFDREAAAMMGIDVDRVIAATFFIGSALAGAAGVLVGLVFGQINHFMGFNYGLKGFTAAVVGGIGSLPARCSAAS